MVREIITIDEDLCTGCGDCVPGCPEGALRIIDGKARLVGDLLCDGLGACVGTCPTGALTVERREAEPYDERLVMQSMVEKGANTVLAHLEHLADHGETSYLNEALAVISETEFDGKEEVERAWAERKSGHAPAAEHREESVQQFQQVHHHAAMPSGCPGASARSFEQREDHAAAAVQTALAESALSHWPVQMHLLQPMSPHFQGCDFVLAADCTAFSFGAFHSSFLKGKKLGIACPKLDDGQQEYLEKLVSLIDDAAINTLTVVIMQVPCCGGLLRLAQAAAASATRRVPIKLVVVGIEGGILQEEWVPA